MPYLCLVEPDEKIASQIIQTLEPLCKEKNLEIISTDDFTKLEEIIKEKNKPTEVVLLTILHVDLAHGKPEVNILSIKSKFKCDVIITAFEDASVKGSFVNSLPVENIVYKPLDAAILFEDVRFALTKGDIVKTTAVFSLSEKCNIEKIRRCEVVAISDFGFICNLKSKIEIGQVFKFYHSFFLNNTQRSVWAKLIHRAEDLNYFLYCAPQVSVVGSMRRKIAESKNKVKSVSWAGLEANASIDSPIIHLHLAQEDEKQKLIDFFQRKFPKAKIVDWKPNPKDPKIDSQVLISDQNWTQKTLEQSFTKTPCFIGVSALPKVRDAIEEIFLTESIRLQYPIDRNFLSKAMTSLFPKLEETEPSPNTWIAFDEKLLCSEVIEVEQLSEAAFIYNRSHILERGSFQEFAISEEDESDLKMILAKTQFVNEKPNQDQNYSHQIVFFGIRDSALKKLRLWMRLRHIQAQGQGA